MGKRRILVELGFDPGDLSGMTAKDIGQWIERLLSKDIIGEVAVTVHYGHPKKCKFCDWAGHVTAHQTACPYCKERAALTLLLPDTSNENFVAWANLSPKANSYLKEITRLTGGSAEVEIECALKAFLAVLESLNGLI